MKKQFVNYEIALKLKQIGFNEECLAHYWNFDHTLSFKPKDELIEIGVYDEFILAPLYQQVKVWLLETYKISINELVCNDGIMFSISTDEPNVHFSQYQERVVMSPDYYNGCSEIILKCLKIIEK